MGDANSSNSADAKTLHPVYSVTNIQNKVRVLDGEKVTYSTWVKLFRLHSHGYDVLDHIDDTPPPAKTHSSYEAWSKIDSIVLQWIYGTLSDDLLARVLEADSTAQQAWNRIKVIFLNNKNSRAATLEHAFTTTTMASCTSMTAYFQKMKDLADQLKDVGHPVSESRLVLQMLLGLPSEFDTVASFITQSDTSWDNAREMLDREQRRQAARQQMPSQPALVASNRPPIPMTHNVPSQHSQSQHPHPSSTNPIPPQPYNPSQTFDSYQHRSTYRGRGRARGHSRGGRGRGRHSYHTTYGSSASYGSYSPNYASHGWWNAPPPSPHPAQSPWTSSWNRPPNNPIHPQPQQPHSTPPGFGLVTPPQPPYPCSPNYPMQPNVDPLQPTDLGAALSTLNLNQTDPTWNFDTGASSHITSDQGSQDWPGTFTP